MEANAASQDPNRKGKSMKALAGGNRDSPFISPNSPSNTDAVMVEHGNATSKSSAPANARSGQQQATSRNDEEGGQAREILDESPEARIERLGRQRPEIFHSKWAEYGFVFSISMSQVLSVSLSTHLVWIWIWRWYRSILFLALRLYCRRWPRSWTFQQPLEPGLQVHFRSPWLASCWYLVAFLTCMGATRYMLEGLFGSLYGVWLVVSQLI